MLLNLVDSEIKCVDVTDRKEGEISDSSKSMKRKGCNQNLIIKNLSTQERLSFFFFFFFSPHQGANATEMPEVTGSKSE